MNYTCRLERIEFRGFHGLFQEEKLFGGRFIIDVELTQQRNDEEKFNELSTVINYQELHQIVTEVFAEREDLLETIASKIRLAIVKRKIDFLKLVIRIDKPDPAGLFGSGSAGITLEYNS